MQAAIEAMQAGRKPAERPLTARERAMSFAKCIQRPASTARLTQSAQVPHAMTSDKINGVGQGHSVWQTIGSLSCYSRGG